MHIHLLTTQEQLNHYSIESSIQLKQEMQVAPKEAYPFFLKCGWASFTRSAAALILTSSICGMELQQMKHGKHTRALLCPKLSQKSVKEQMPIIHFWCLAGLLTCRVGPKTGLTAAFDTSISRDPNVATA